MRIVFLFILFLGAIACKKALDRPPAGVNPGPVVTHPVNDSSYTYLALGDSYTIGQSVQVPDRYPVQTVARLRTDGFVNMRDPQIIATTGWTTDDLWDALNVQHPSGPYTIVSLLIGVNDQYQRHDTIGYRDRFWNLLNRSIQLAGGRRDHVFVISIPDYSVTPFATYYDTGSIRKQLGWFNAINKELAEQNYCHYLDITASTREAANDPSLIAADGLHPSGKEYNKWAMRLAEQIEEVLP